MRTEADFEDPADERPDSPDHVTSKPDLNANDLNANDRNDGNANDGNANDRAAAAKIEALEGRVASMEAELDAVRGLLGGIEAVDEAVEQRASIALAKVESLERRVGEEDGLVRERLSDTPADERSRSSNDSGGQAVDAAEPASPRAEADSGSLATRLRDAFQ